MKIYEKATMSVPVHDGEGVAANGSMLRIDVFHVEGDGYYFVPIYVADTLKKKLPDKAVAGGRKGPDFWKKVCDEAFIFSLYPGDLVRIRSKKGVKLIQAKGGTGEEAIICNDGLFYYKGADISTASVAISTHDRRYDARGVGLKTLLSVEKYQVDVLGNYSKVRLPEKRMGFYTEE